MEAKESRNPLWSGHSFRRNFAAPGTFDEGGSQSPLVGAFVPAEGQQDRKSREEQVAIPSGRGIRSGNQVEREQPPAENRVAIPSGRGIRSGQIPADGDHLDVQKSQSPLVGAFVPARNR